MSVGYKSRGSTGVIVVDDDIVVVVVVVVDGDDAVEEGTRVCFGDAADDNFDERFE
jgi:hypothetical protein